MVRARVRRDLRTTGLDGGGRTVFVLVDHVLVEGFAVELVGLLVHEGAHERGEVESGVAVEHRFVVDQLVGGLGQHLLVAQAVQVMRGRLAGRAKSGVSSVLSATSAIRPPGESAIRVLFGKIGRSRPWRRHRSRPWSSQRMATSRRPVSQSGVRRTARGQGGESASAGAREIGHGVAVPRSLGRTGHRHRAQGP